MSKDRFSLMDFVKRQSIGSIQQVFGEECLNEDGTIMSFAEQADVITHYLKLEHNPRFAEPYKKKAEELLRFLKSSLL